MALVGVSNGSIQFAAYEEIKRRRTDLKRRVYEGKAREWRVEDEKLVSSVALVDSVEETRYTCWLQLHQRSGSVLLLSKRTLLWAKATSID